jgi:hypothetical protein
MVEPPPPEFMKRRSREAGQPKSWRGTSPYACRSVRLTIGTKTIKHSRVVVVIADLSSHLHPVHCGDVTQAPHPAPSQMAWTEEPTGAWVAWPGLLVTAATKPVIKAIIIDSLITPRGRSWGVQVGGQFWTRLHSAWKFCCRLLDHHAEHTNCSSSSKATRQFGVRSRGCFVVEELEFRGQTFQSISTTPSPEHHCGSTTRTLLGLIGALLEVNSTVLLGMAGVLPNCIAVEG